MNVATTQSISARAFKRGALSVLSMTPLMLAILGSNAVSNVAHAADDQVAATPQAAAAPQAAEAPVEEVVVTGSRIVRDGYEAPTPVTVVGVEQLQTQATTNIADTLNLLPQFSGSSTPISTAGGVNGHTQGINGLNLRGLGSSRTLVLLNGQRVVGSVSTGLVDVNQLPQQLVSRVDTVFGGASAEYGSDALTGVVNFVLDTKFTGVKGEVSGGVTTFGDDRNWKFSITAGTGFADDRGHIEFSGEMAASDGILSPNTRPWNLQGNMMMNNPAYGTGAGRSTSVPQYIHATHVGMSNAAPGGLITSGPLKGTLFGAGGAISKILYGSIISDPLMSGGSWQDTTESQVFAYALDPKQTHQNAFLRLSYDVTDNINVYVSAMYGHAYNESNSVAHYRTGDITVRSDNPYIPTPILQSMTQLGITSFSFGTMNKDMIGTTPVADRGTVRYLVGADGTFDAFDTSWKWDTHLSNGRLEGYSAAKYMYKPAYYNRAIDAVRNPTTGQIVCRSTLTDPTNGCIPYNLFGTGVNSQAAINYVRGNTAPFFHDRYIQTVAGFNVSGEPFSLWAGPVSIATGFEYRVETYTTKNDIGNQLGEWFITSGTAFNGKFSVAEGYVATVVPLATDETWAKKLEMSGAVRATGYSTFGTTATWKLGLNYTPIDDVRFRLTESRDIREPTMVDLYSTPVTATFGIANPFLNNQTVNSYSVTSGNPNLQPESALSTGLGVVLQPRWIPGFSMSFDYYRIDISSAISSISAQQILALCYAGNATACTSVSTIGQDNLGPVLQITTGPRNFASELAKGFDVEAGYTLPLEMVKSDWVGSFGIRMFATHYITDVQSAGVLGVIPVELAGQNAGTAVPHWKWQVNFTYMQEMFSAGLTVRGVSAGVYNNNWITCTTGCPVSTANNITSDINYLPAAAYLDFNTTYKMNVGETSVVELFFNARNLANKNPPVYYPGPNNNAWQIYPAAQNNYDILGRVFRAGMRFKM